MNIRLEINRAGGSVEVRSVRGSDSDCAAGTVEGACPGCDIVPFLVKGANMRRNPNRSHDEYMADGHCIGCDDPVGHIYARVDTIFGLEEDERVVNGRARVY